MNRCLLFAVCVLASCQHRDNDGRTSTPSSAVAPRPAPADPVPNDGDLSGRVVETMDAGGYTYARLDRGGTQIWIAGPKTTLAVGTQLARLEGQLMADFHSNTLNRTFPQIYFVTGFGASAAPVAKLPPNHPAPAAAAPAADAGDDVSGTVVATMDGGGYTYAQLDQNGTKVWVAGPATKLAVGTKVGRMTGTLMTGFKSTTLDRTFDQIYFVGTYAVDPARTN